MFKENAIVLLALVAIAIIARATLQLWLERKNLLYAFAKAKEVPARLAGFVQPEEYQRTMEYTYAKGRFSRVEIIFDTTMLLFWLFSGILPELYDVFQSFGRSPWVESGFLLCTGLLMALPSLPLSWYWQFRTEERFGFNRTTTRLWLLDRLKGLGLGILIGWPLLTLILKLVDWTGPNWWLWTWILVLVFQLSMMVLAPMLIIPLFNKLTPLPEGELKNRLLSLGSRTGFHAQNIQVIDGSKRSTHSNAYFTGFGRFRRIVLFDTLIEQLNIAELEAVLAHEIGHYKLKHIPKLLLVSAVSMLVSFWIMGWLANTTWFAAAFGFPQGAVAPVLLIFGLVAGVFTFWIEPFVNQWSRRYEYQADAYARNAVEGADSLIGALRKLNLKNLSNLSPHPLYSAFYYSHPTLLEREDALLGKA